MACSSRLLGQKPWWWTCKEPRCHPQTAQHTAQARRWPCLAVVVRLHAGEAGYEVFKARVAHGLCLRSAVPAPRPPVLLTIGFWWAGRASQGISSVSRYRCSSRFISVHLTCISKGHLRVSQHIHLAASPGSHVVPLHPLAGVVVARGHVWCVRAMTKVRSLLN